ncbi:DUF2058 domain-containing protein [Catenovulum sp. 2E275]|uniref:DUF2058 domain-containing protein n=1 Tax=Catenovulum sp. 2E275 TaxID=2980497 RepID=UPI0021D3D38B|nr:DUF2058 domain-containing protein [Catenovulum sp. 2E275]MCU4676814.1 DUF2058 domain-containing protein [Catenovulum sp. 2E275]
MSSLQDQLLKAGLTTQKKAKKAAKGSKKSRTLKKEVKAATEQTKSEQQAKSEQANLVLKKEAEQKAIAAQIKQLIENNQIEQKGEIKYNFEHNGVIKSILVNDKLQNQLVKGYIGIAVLGETYYVIPATAAEKISQRDEGYIVLLNTLAKSDEQVDDVEEDPYKDFVIPDDLMW